MPKLNIENINYNTENMILVISGTMASGKDTVLRLLKKDIDFYTIKSITSRAKRHNEKDNHPYKFISRNEFKKMIKQKQFWEAEESYNNFYGITKSEIRKALDGNIPIVFRVNEQGVVKIKNIFPKAKLFFIAPPSLNTIKERIICRVNVSKSLKNKRLKSAKLQLSKLTRENIYDYVIFNKNSKESAKKIAQILSSLTKKQKT